MDRKTLIKHYDTKSTCKWRVMDWGEKSERERERERKAGTWVLFNRQRD